MQTKSSVDGTKSSYQLLLTLRNHVNKKAQVLYVTHTTSCLDPHGKPPGTECSTANIQHKSEAHNQSNEVSTCCKDVALVRVETNAPFLY
jgi:hypothetical protein